MSDLKDFKALLTRWGVPFDEQATQDHGPYGDGPIVDVIAVTITEEGAYTYQHSENKVPKSERVIGYNGFFTDVQFTPDGEFKTWGCWE